MLVTSKSFSYKQTEKIIILKHKVDDRNRSSTVYVTSAGVSSSNEEVLIGEEWTYKFHLTNVTISFT